MTTFDEDGLPQATNHAGWVVQELTDDGWKRITLPLVVKSDAKLIRDGLISRRPNNEYRVYEALQNR
jgi:hypothetical protein